MWNDVEQLKEFKKELILKGELAPTRDSEEFDMDALMDSEVTDQKFNTQDLILSVVFTQIISLISAIQLRIQYLEERSELVSAVEEETTDKIWD